MEGLYVLSTFEMDAQRREALFNKFTALAVNHSDHLQPGFAAFYLSAFSNTKYSDIPAGVLQGKLNTAHYSQMIYRRSTGLPINSMGTPC